MVKNSGLSTIKFLISVLFSPRFHRRKRADRKNDKRRFSANKTAGSQEIPLQIPTLSSFRRKEKEQPGSSRSCRYTRSALRTKRPQNDLSDFVAPAKTPFAFPFLISRFPPLPRYFVFLFPFLFRSTDRSAFRKAAKFNHFFTAFLRIYFVFSAIGGVGTSSIRRTSSLSPRLAGVLSPCSFLLLLFSAFLRPFFRLSAAFSLPRAIFPSDLPVGSYGKKKAAPGLTARGAAFEAEDQAMT